MHRLFLSSRNISEDKIEIVDKKQAHYLKDVLRLKNEDQVVFFDQQGNEYFTRIEEISGQKLSLKIMEKRSFSDTSKVRLTVACAIPKKSKMDDIIDKLTQLGVDKIIPLETERVVVRLNKEKKSARLKRWEKVALSAAQQSQRKVLPLLMPVQNVKEVLAQAKDYDLKLIPTLEGGKKKTLREIFSHIQPEPRQILALIGPEGDFTPSEVESAKKAGCIAVTLGDTVLRVETAAVAVASFIKFYAHD